MYFIIICIVMTVGVVIFLLKYYEVYNLKVNNLSNT